MAGLASSVDVTHGELGFMHEQAESQDYTALRAAVLQTIPLERRSVVAIYAKVQRSD
jgi:hypothetical protein